MEYDEASAIEKSILTSSTRVLVLAGLCSQPDTDFKRRIAMLCRGELARRKPGTDVQDPSHALGK